MSARLSPLDRWTLAYVALLSLGALSAWPPARPLPPGLPLGNAALVAVVLLAPRLRRGGTAGRLVGEFYPLLAIYGLYREVGLINAAAGASHDAAVQRWEELLFGFQPSLAWIRAWPWPWLSWTLHLGYLSYFLVLAGAPLGLWIGGRREAARDTVALTLLAFYLCGAAFLAFPVAGPRYLFPPADNAATAIPIVAFTHRLLDGGSAWGTAFPSSHVAAGLTAAVSALLLRRGLGAVLVALALLLTLGTVYGQFHYALDAIAGVVVAAAVLALRHRLLPRGP